MDVYKITGGKPLQGSIKVSGAKNSAVALIPASILADSLLQSKDCQKFRMSLTLQALLEDIGGKVEFDKGTMTIDPTEMISMPLPNGNVKKLRASYYMMGAMLGRFKHAVIGLPGGCHLGPRPIDQHIKGFEALGAKVTNEHGAIYLRAEELRGAKIYLDVISVGATINIMLAAVLAKGRTTIENAAKEPEIIDVATLLSNMGAKIKGAGTNVIRIDGVEKLHGTKHTIIPDRIEAGTFMIMAAAAGDGVTIDNVIPFHVEALTAKLREMGVDVVEGEEQIFIPKSRKLASRRCENTCLSRFSDGSSTAIFCVVDTSNWTLPSLRIRFTRLDLNISMSFEDECGWACRRTFSHSSRTDAASGSNGTRIGSSCRCRTCYCRTHCRRSDGSTRNSTYRAWVQFTYRKTSRNWSGYS